MYIERRALAEFRKRDCADAGWAPDGLTAEDIDLLLQEFPESVAKPASDSVVDLGERRRRRRTRRTLSQVKRTVGAPAAAPTFGGEAA